MKSPLFLLACQIHAKPLLLTCFFLLHAPVIQADQSKTSKLDKDTIYRLDLFTETLKPQLKKDLKVGAVYFRFSTLSGHHVWSRLSKENMFELNAILRD